MAKKKKEPEDKEASREAKARKKMMDQVAKHLRFNVPVKNAVIKGRKVEYFVASKVLDCLMESKWKEKPVNEEDDITPYFTIRDVATKYCATLLEYGYFVRANKVEVKPKGEAKETTPKAGGGKSERGKEGGETRKRKVTDSPRGKKQSQEETAEEGKKKKRKFRLEVHQQQVFKDSDDVYYWQYDPASWWTYIIGFGVVLGAIAVTLQPLWPDSTRLGFWYLNMGLVSIVGTIVAGLILRWFLFGLVLIITVGKVHFWILPNLENEKLGFFESFFPFYSVEVSSGKTEKKSAKKKKKKVYADDPKDEGGVEKTSNGEESGSGERDDKEEEEGEEEEEVDGGGGSQDPTKKDSDEDIQQIDTPPTET